MMDPSVGIRDFEGSCQSPGKPHQSSSATQNSPSRAKHATSSAQTNRESCIRHHLHPRPTTLPLRTTFIVLVRSRDERTKWVDSS